MLKSWEPIYESHAIEQAVVSVEFSQTINEMPWKRAQALAETSARKWSLQTKQAITELEVKIDNATRTTKQVARDVGLEFQKLENPNFASDKLKLLPTSLILETWRYTRWSAFEQKIGEMLLPLVELYLANVPLKAVAIMYVDRFHAKDGNRKPDCSEVIDLDSTRLASHVHEKTGQWHSHIGYYQDTAETELVNVKVDVSDLPTAEQKKLRTIRIQTLLVSKSDGLTLGSEPIFEIERLINSLHVKSKEIFGDVISNDAAETISLNES